MWLTIRKIATYVFTGTLALMLLWLHAARPIWADFQYMIITDQLVADGLVATSAESDYAFSNVINAARPAYVTALSPQPLADTTRRIFVEQELIDAESADLQALPLQETFTQQPTSVRVLLGEPALEKNQLSTGTLNQAMVQLNTESESATSLVLELGFRNATRCQSTLNVVIGEHVRYEIIFNDSQIEHRWYEWDEATQNWAAAVRFVTASHNNCSTVRVDKADASFATYLGKTQVSQFKASDGLDNHEISLHWVDNILIDSIDMRALTVDEAKVVQSLAAQTFITEAFTDSFETAISPRWEVLAGVPQVIDGALVNDTDDTVLLTLPSTDLRTGQFEIEFANADTACTGTVAVYANNLWMFEFFSEFSLLGLAVTSHPMHVMQRKNLPVRERAPLQSCQTLMITAVEDIWQIYADERLLYSGKNFIDPNIHLPITLGIRGNIAISEVRYFEIESAQ